jgi:hypothetical protein
VKKQREIKLRGTEREREREEGSVKGQREFRSEETQR